MSDLAMTALVLAVLYGTPLLVVSWLVGAMFFRAESGIGMRTGLGALTLGALLIALTLAGFALRFVLYVAGV